jgi:acetylornithine deacetylase/succinyl-diaminopimelate desuccinylase-like protein
VVGPRPAQRRARAGEPAARHDRGGCRAAVRQRRPDRRRTGINAIAAQASAAVEWRATDQATLDRQEAALADLTVSPGLELRAERLDRRPAGSVPLSHPLVAAVLRARRSAGLPQVTGGGSTDANAALAAGIPAVALGCCEGAGMHAPTERIRADSIGTGAGQLRAVLAEILERNP